MRTVDNSVNSRLMAGCCPNSEAVHLDELHRVVMQRGTTVADPNAEAHDRITVNAG
jgi:hypothetical protein